MFFPLHFAINGIVVVILQSIDCIYLIDFSIKEFTFSNGLWNYCNEVYGHLLLFVLLQQKLFS